VFEPVFAFMGRRLSYLATNGAGPAANRAGPAFLARVQS